jgi:hypothetical protein
MLKVLNRFVMELFAALSLSLNLDTLSADRKSQLQLVVERNCLIACSW